VLIVAFNAATTIAHVLDRIRRDFVPRVDSGIVQ